MRVLRIEDDWKPANLIARAIGAERFTLAVTWDGPGGGETAAAGHDDRIILGLRLPGFSGTERQPRVRRWKQHGLS